MVILRMRSQSEVKDMIKKLKKMHKFTKELVECFEEKLDDDDYDEDYRYEDDDYEDEHPVHRRGSTSGNVRRYRKSM